MSKVSRQQTTKTRDRAESTPPKSDQPTTVGALATKALPPRPPMNTKATSAASLDEELAPPSAEEDDFFARGEVNSSFPPSAMDVKEAAKVVEEDDDGPPSIPLTPAQIERRARLRRVVGGVVGAAALLTALVGAKTLAARTQHQAGAAEGTLNVPHQVVPSIALAAPEEPAAAQAAIEKPVVAETTAPVDNGAQAATDPSSAAATPPPEMGAEEALKAEEAKAEEAKKDQAQAVAANVRRLPVINLEIPNAPDPATDRQWESAAKTLASKDFKGADSAFAELSKRADTPTRETARLARALWWTANGRESEVKPVIADLAANAATPYVRQHARELIGIN